MERESYQRSLERVVTDAGIEVADLATLERLVYERRHRLGLLREDDFEKMKSGGIRWRHRVRSAIRSMRKAGKAARIGRAFYRFFL